MKDYTETPILPFRTMEKINIKIDEVCGITRKGKCYMSEAKRIKARKARKKHNNHKRK